MKNLNIYISEGLADWGEDETLNKRMSKQTTKVAIKQEIIDWIQENYKDNFVKVKKTKLKFDFSTSPVTVDYNDVIISKNSKELTNGVFKWGYVDKFVIEGNDNLVDLEGCPEECRELRCNWSNNIRSLKGAPKLIRGDLYLSYCDGLISLEGCTQTLSNIYIINCNNLKSLKGGPQEVFDYECNNCGLLSLEGAPKKANNFMCSLNPLITLKGAPEELTGFFNCNGCKNLKTLEGAPKKCVGFSCNNCSNLKSLKGGPQIVYGDFSCNYTNITNFEGSPKEVKGMFFSCDCEKLESLKGMPEYIQGNFGVSRCPNLKTLKDGTGYINGYLMCRGTPITQNDYSGEINSWGTSKRNELYMK